MGGIVYGLLFVTVISIGGLATYLVQDKQRRTREAKRVEREERAAKVEVLRRAVWHRLRSTPIQQLNFAELVRDSQVSDGDARQVAVEVLGHVCARAASDGVVTENEKASIRRLAEALGLDNQSQSQIEADAKQSEYRKRLDDALMQSGATAASLKHLDELRANLGLSRDQISAATQSTGPRAYAVRFRQLISDGSIDRKKIEELHTIRATLGMTDEAAFEAIREEALDIYRARFFESKQDGEITKEEEALLDRLQHVLHIPDEYINSYKQQVARTRLASELRSGRLPTAKTTKLLEGGEICHWDSQCSYMYETKRGPVKADGEIVLTSSRVIFVSTTKSLEFKPSRIVNIVEHGNAVELSTSSRGTGWYFVADPDLFAACLEGVVRKHKYANLDAFGSTMARHIPSDVKRDVWARDGGRCTGCDANDYLEFDHIIPHSKGGASTAGNVQLLCRRCNSLKSDRIG